MKLLNLTNKELISLYKDGDNKAFEMLWERYKDKVFKFIYFRTFDVDTTKDILQDTFLKVIIAIQTDKYFESGQFVSWIYSIAHNLIVDSQARRKIITVNADESFIDIADSLRFSEKSIEDVLSNEQVMTDLRHAIKLLPVPQYEILQMRFFQNLRFREIAEITNVSENTALGRMRYALINLRKIVSEQHISLDLN